MTTADRTPDHHEIDAAVAAVRAAARLCASTQGRLLAGDTLTKRDESPVTVADFAAQAVVCAVLSERLGALALVGEESSGRFHDEVVATVVDVLDG